jgi:uncharacterized membrane protein
VPAISAGIQPASAANDVLWSDVLPDYISWRMVRRLTSSKMKNGVFWDVTPCGSCKNGLFGGT